MLSDHHRRSFRGLRNLVNFYGADHQHQQQQQQSQNINDDLDNSSSVALPKHLHLPPSLTSPDTISPLLWSWIHSGDFTDASSQGAAVGDNFYYGAAAATAASTATIAAIHSPRLSAYSGQHIPLPDHLQHENLEKLKIKAVKANLRGGGLGHQAAPPPNALFGSPSLSRSKSLGRQEGRAMAASRNALASVSGTIRGKALPRKPIYHGGGGLSTMFDQSATTITHADTAKIPRFYLQLLNIKIKSSINVNGAYFRVQTGSSQCFYSEKFQTVKESVKGFGLGADLMEGFIFDVPTDRDEFTVTIRLFAGESNNNTLPISPSMESFGHASTRSSTNKIMAGLSNLLQSSGVSEPVSPPVAANTLLGELSFSLPTKNAFPKVTGTYAFSLNGKKEVAKCVMQMGMLMDEPFVAIPEEPEVPVADYLNFYIHTATTPVWRKYWCILRQGELEIYDFEYKGMKPIIAKIPISCVHHVSRCNPEVMSTSNTLEINMNSTFIPRSAFVSSITTLTLENSQQEQQCDDVAAAVAIANYNGGGLVKCPSRDELNEDEWEETWRKSVTEEKKLVVSVGAGSLKGPLVVYAMADGKLQADEWLNGFTTSLRSQ